MKLSLIDTDIEVVRAWEKAFREFPEVEIRHGNILEYARNTLVSPANSCGFMDGGIDRKYCNFFGMEIEKRVREKISRRSEGYLPVGEAIIVETGHEKITHLLSAPTMSLPEPIPSINCGKAMMAILLLAQKNEAISHVYCPGLGTGVGRVSPINSANEMALAYKMWLKKFKT